MTSITSCALPIQAKLLRRIPFAIGQDKVGDRESHRQEFNIHVITGNDCFVPVNRIRINRQLANWVVSRPTGRVYKFFFSTYFSETPAAILSWPD